MTAVAQFVDVTVDYEVRGSHVRGLDGLSASFDPSTTTAIVGRSGSGKSTAISVLSLLRKPTRGQVYLEGVDVTRLGEQARAQIRARRIGVVFQSFNLETSISALENVIVPRMFLRSASVSHAKQDALQLLEALQIGHLAHRRPSAMSGGEKQRLAVARALINRPALVLADEPTGSLDEATEDRVIGHLHSATTSVGAALVVVTHDRTVAARADRTLHLSAGRLIDPSQEQPGA